MNARQKAWQGSHWIRPEKRLAIYAREGFLCLWCQGKRKSPLSLDHLWPAPEGKKQDNRATSLVTACGQCNSARAHRRLAVWLRVLRESGADLPAIVSRLRAAVKTPIDREKGKALLADAAVKKARQAAGHAFRRARLFDRADDSGEPESEDTPWAGGDPYYPEDSGPGDDVPF